MRWNKRRLVFWVQSEVVHTNVRETGIMTGVQFSTDGTWSGRWTTRRIEFLLPIGSHTMDVVRLKRLLMVKVRVVCDGEKWVQGDILML